MNKIKNLLIISLSLLLLGIDVSGQKLIEDEIGNVLRKMLTARKKYRYMGDVTVKIRMGRQPRIYKKRIWVEPPNRMREEIVIQKTNRRIVRILNNGKFETNAGGKSFLSLRRRHLYPRFGLLRRMRRNFNISISDDKMIAGRETKLIIMKPRIKYGRRFRNWIDKETGITLRKEILRSNDEKSKPVYEMYFRSIDYDPPKNPDLFRIGKKSSQPLGIETSDFATIEEARESIRFPFLEPENIPEGYQLDRVRVTRERKNVTVHMNYDNGITSFSIFQTIGPIPPYFRRIFRKKNKDNIIEIVREARTIYFRKIGPFNLILIGNCQKEIIKPILKSFSLPKKSQS